MVVIIPAPLADKLCYMLTEISDSASDEQICIKAALVASFFRHVRVIHLVAGYCHLFNTQLLVCARYSRNEEFWALLVVLDAYVASCIFR